MDSFLAILGSARSQISVTDTGDEVMEFRSPSPLNNGWTVYQAYHHLTRDNSLGDLAQGNVHLTRLSQELRSPQHSDSFLSARASILSYTGLESATREKFLAKAMDERLRLARAALVQESIAVEMAKQRYLKAVLVDRLQSLQSEIRRDVPQPSPTAPTDGDLESNWSVIKPTSVPETATKRTKLQLVQRLGSVLRKRSDPLVDCAEIKVDGESETDQPASKGRSKGDSMILPFPQHLHKMLVQVEMDGESNIVSFCPHGRAFKIHDMDRFVGEILPKYFKLSKWTSFRRQLNLYGFLRVHNGPDMTAYYHVLFLQSRPDLAQYMKRVAVPDGQADRRRVCLKYDDHGEDPNFYALPPART